jgi:hypothetical protein
MRERRIAVSENYADPWEQTHLDLSFKDRLSIARGIVVRSAIVIGFALLMACQACESRARAKANRIIVIEFADAMRAVTNGQGDGDQGASELLDAFWSTTARDTPKICHQHLGDGSAVRMVW